MRSSATSTFGRGHFESLKQEADSRLRQEVLDKFGTVFDATATLLAVDTSALFEDLRHKLRSPRLSALLRQLLDPMTSAFFA